MLRKKWESISGVGSDIQGNISMLQKMNLDQRLEKDKLCKAMSEKCVFARDSQGKNVLDVFKEKQGN